MSRRIYTVLVGLALLMILTTIGCAPKLGLQPTITGPSAEEVEKAKKNLTEAETKVKTAEAGKKTAEQERDAKKTELEGANAKLAEAQTTVQTLQEEVASGKVTRGDLEERLKTALTAENTAVADLKAKQNELDEAQKAKTEAFDRVKELQQKLDAAPTAAELATLKEDLKKAKADVATAEGKVTTLEGQLTAAQSGTPADITKLRADLKEANEAKDAAVARANKAEADLKAVPTAAELAKLKEDLTKANEAKGKVESKVTGLEKERDTAKADLVKANARIAVLEGQVKDLQKGVPIDTAKLQKDLAEALAAQKTAEAERDAKQIELNQANAKLAKAEETIGELRKEITTLKQQLAAAPKAGGTQTGSAGQTNTQQSVSSDCPVPDFDMKAGEIKLVQAGCSVKGDVELGNSETGPWTKLYDDDPTTGLVVTCVQPQGCWVRAPFGANVGPRRVNDLESEIKKTGCESNKGCKDVVRQTWPKGAPCDYDKGGQPLVCQSKAPPSTQKPTPTPTVVVPQKPSVLTADCGFELTPGEKRTVPAGCVIGGDVFVGPTDGDWQIRPDSLNYTGMVVEITKPAVVWSPYGGEIHPSTVISADTVESTMKIVGCHLVSGCRFVDRKTW